MVCLLPIESPDISYPSRGLCLALGEAYIFLNSFSSCQLRSAGQMVIIVSMTSEGHSRLFELTCCVRFLFTRFGSMFPALARPLLLLCSIAVWPCFLSSRCEINRFQIICCFFHLGSPWLEAELRQRRRVAEPLFAVFLRGINFFGGLAEGFSSRVSFGTKGFPSGQFLMLHLCDDLFVPQILGHVALRGGFKHLFLNIELGDMTS